jgi:hypothetical protein
MGNCQGSSSAWDMLTLGAVSLLPLPRYSISRRLAVVTRVKDMGSYLPALPHHQLIRMPCSRAGPVGKWVKSMLKNGSTFMPSRPTWTNRT